jgi:hypothetical protein
MRFLMMIKATQESEAGLPCSPQLMGEMGALAEELMKAGVMLACEGLMPSSMGARLGYSRGKRSLTDGPFSEAKELIGGFAIIRAESKDEAVAMGDRVLEIHARHGIPDFAMEIRPLFDPETVGTQPQ